MKQLTSLVKIEYLFGKRNWAVFIMGVGMPVAFFLFFSGMYQFDSEEIKIRAVKQMLISMTAFSSISFGLFSLPFSFIEDKTSNWALRLRHTPVPIGYYYLARFIRMIVNMMVAIMMVFAVGAGIRGISMNISEWFGAFWLLVVGSACFLAIGFVLTLITSTEVLSVASNVLYLGLAMLGGMWIPVDLFPEWMQQIAKLTPTYHLVNLANTYAQKQEFSVESFLVLLSYAIISVVVTLVVKKRLEVN